MKLKSIPLLLLLATLMLLLVGCGTSSSAYKDILISCGSVSTYPDTNQLKLRSDSFSEQEGRIHCHGGDWIETLQSSMSGGKRIRSLEFNMVVREYESENRAQKAIDMVKSQIGHRDANRIVRLSNLPWHPSVNVDDFAEAGYRTWLDILTGYQSVPYELTARVGKVIFIVWASDFAEHKPRESWPVGNAMWEEVERVIEVLVVRYRNNESPMGD